MTLDNFVKASYLKATGTVSTLSEADDEYTKLVQLANIYQQNWANEPGVDWKSLYRPKISCGTVTATDTFALDSSIHKISQNLDDPVRILWSDGTNYTDFTVMPGDSLKSYSSANVVAKIGSNLVFSKSFTTNSPELGGTIYVPAYMLPATLVSSVDLIAVDDSNWLVTICAAEYVRNNLVRQNQYPNLLTEANELMKKMVENNNSQLATIVRRPAVRGRSW